MSRGYRGLKLFFIFLLAGSQQPSFSFPLKKITFFFIRGNFTSVLAAIFLSITVQWGGANEITRFKDDICLPALKKSIPRED